MPPKATHGDCPLCGPVREGDFSTPARPAVVEEVVSFLTRPSLEERIEKLEREVELLRRQLAFIGQTP